MSLEAAAEDSVKCIISRINFRN